nr:hypothetical protein GCM10020185_87510 [Pseudomonas brassicacearum subsp. brassicacearum]
MPQALSALVKKKKVSEQLLPYHVAKVEQLYKDKFRATLKQRLTAASVSIGLPEEVADVLIKVETTLSPVFEQLNALSVDVIPEGVLVRVKKLVANNRYFAIWFGSRC